MDKHPIPRQVTTFEFKLIGFFTVRQFVYLVVFALLAVLVYFIIPIPYLNFISGAVVFGVGAIFSLAKYNERSFDIWLVNLVRSVVAPSQYYYKKAGGLPEYFSSLPITDPGIKKNHIDAQQKLASYLSKDKNTADDDRKRQIASLIGTTTSKDLFSPTNQPVVPAPAVVAPSSAPPFFSGMVKNHQELSLPNIMIYVKDKEGKLLRILKTNTRGVFASFHPLTSETYLLEAKDPDNRYFFDTIKVAVNDQNSQPIIIHSKELL